MASCTTSNLLCNAAHRFEASRDGDGGRWAGRTDRTFPKGEYAAMPKPGQPDGRTYGPAVPDVAFHASYRAFAAVRKICALPGTRWKEWRIPPRYDGVLKPMNRLKCCDAPRK